MARYRPAASGLRPAAQVTPLVAVLTAPTRPVWPVRVAATAVPAATAGEPVATSMALVLALPAAPAGLQARMRVPVPAQPEPAQAEPAALPPAAAR